MRRGRAMKRKRNRSLNACQRTLLPVMVVLIPLALVEGAEAACTPASPVNDTIVTCTGTTPNQNDPNGFGTATDTGNTINVQPGAVVTGQQFGIEAASTTVNNNGRIESTDALGAAVHAATADVTNNNNGVIRSPSFGVQTSGATNLMNSGTIKSTARIAILAGSADIVIPARFRLLPAKAPCRRRASPL